MMPAAGALRREFRSCTEASRLRRQVLAEQEERLRRARREDAREDAAQHLADIAVMALTPTEIAAFRVELESYDTATVIALQENGLALEEAQRRLDEILLRALVLPDGRRVFKTEDGTRVFDELGAEVDPSIISPEDIDGHHPSWETYRSHRHAIERLHAERSAILDYQQRLDDARERLNRGDLSREDYERLHEDLKTSVPEPVRQHLPAVNASDDAVPVRTKVSLEISRDMVPSPMLPGFS